MDSLRTLDRVAVPRPPSLLPRVLDVIPRPIVDAVGTALLSVAASAFGFAGLWDLFRVTPSPISPWWALAFALPGCVLIALRDRIPPLLALPVVAALFAGDAATVGGLGSLVVLLDVLWHAVHRATARARRGVAVALVIVAGGFLVFALLRTSDVRVAMLVTLQIATLLGTDYWWAVAVGRAEEVAALERRRATDAAREAVRDERETMARELHDLVAGHVSAMAIRSEAALSTPPDETRDRAALRAVRDASLDAHAALRSMIAVLRDGGDAPAPAPRLADIPELARAAERAGLTVRIADERTDERTTGGRAGTLPALVDQTAARVVREALANGARHAVGAEVRVRLSNGADRLLIRIDSHGGRGASGPALAGSGTGLAVLAECVRALGGEFSAGPEGDGWSVRAELPRGAAP
ncbi:sensor histidine kinase [Microbacterium azadirachtae]|uniref:histidine kinase n=1 Tax=Microbacterium azadirachtae TaxID=582680 RepID=A0A0F0LRB0_9MICO|nr:histidine kinase [Microbacterium azadirachtae]KJL34081.1 Sensor protein VraS [Microbacterium azadirachtae]